MESDPLIICPPKVSPVREAEVSPHAMPVPWVLKWRIISVSPSPSTSSRADCTGAASVPVAPKSTVVGSTVVASKESVVRMATGIFPLLLGLMLFGKLPGLMSIATESVSGSGTALKLVTSPITRACVTVPAGIWRIRRPLLQSWRLNVVGNDRLEIVVAVRSISCMLNALSVVYRREPGNDKSKAETFRTSPAPPKLLNTSTNNPLGYEVQNCRPFTVAVSHLEALSMILSHIRGG